ncbi:hypothetical protein LINPERHAP2_LOCUS14700 [Linum perenne]
MINLENDV